MATSPEIGKQAKKSSPAKSIFYWLNKVILVEKLYNVPGAVLLVLFAVIVALGTAYISYTFGFLMLGLIFVFPFLYCIVFYPKFGIVLLIIIAYFIWQIAPFVPIPIGTLMDGLEALLLIGLLIQIKFFGGREIFRNNVTTVLLIWLIYNFIEVGNPTATSRLAWVYTIRTVGTVGLTYYIYMYNVRSIRFIRFILVLWLACNLAGALYGFKQEFIGFSPSEEAYLHSDPMIANLLFIAGHWRKFSFFSDPVVFSYNMIMPCILCICVIAGEFKLWKKVVCAVLILIFFMASLFSGTRGANVLLPAAMLLFAILKYNKQILIAAAVAGVFFYILIIIPTSNANLLRFQTAFSPNNDDSYKVRKMNQARIQPFILTHPMGGGLGATGTWGKRFSPGTMLANFPPDSGYVRVAVEEGWLGLFIFCLMMFVFIKTGIDNYYKIQDPELKTYCLTMTLVVFTYNIANFPQEALVQYPSNVLFYLEVALINITYQLDQELTKKKQAALIAQNAVV
ncbi:MAG: O-antigen ligase family protein [Mucilaginibacter sp.]